MNKSTHVTACIQDMTRQSSSSFRLTMPPKVASMQDMW